MTTCKTAWLVLRANLGQLLAYLIGLSMLAGLLAMGVSMDSSNTDAQSFDPPRSTLAIIDRDSNGEHRFGTALRSYLTGSADIVDMQDSEMAIDDAMATQQVDVIIIVPQGYAQDFVSAARSSGDMPALEYVGTGNGEDSTENGGETETGNTGSTSSAGSAGSTDSAASSQSAASSLETMRISGFLDSMRMALAMDTSADLDSAFDAIAQQSGTDKSRSATVSVYTPAGQREQAAAAEANAEGSAPSRVLRGSAAAMIYAITLAVSLATIIVMTAFNDPRAVERIAVSAAKPRRVRLQLLLVCSAIGVAMWLCCLAMALGFAAARGGGLASINRASMTLTAVTMLVLCLVSVAFGFFVGEFRVSSAATNGVVNTVGLASAFLSGAWLPQWLMQGSVAAIAKCLPGWWYVDALNQAFGGGSSAIAAPHVAGWAASTALMAAFGILFVLAGLLVGRIKKR